MITGDLATRFLIKGVLNTHMVVFWQLASRKFSYSCFVHVRYMLLQVAIFCSNMTNVHLIHAIMRNHSRLRIIFMIDTFSVSLS